jgi:hypothetical protein
MGHYGLSTLLRSCRGSIRSVCRKVPGGQDLNDRRVSGELLVYQVDEREWMSI